MNSQANQPVIVQFDGDKYYIQVTNLILYPVGGSLQASAIGRDKAINLLRDIGQQKIVPDIVIIDSLIESNHEEGEKIATKVRELAPQAKIIAYTILKEKDEVPWADFLAVKSQIDPSRTLIEALKSAGVNLEKGKTIDRS